MTKIDSLARYSLLGRSGLRVSPLCLGTMTFGTEWGWGSEKDAARQILDRFLDAGGNFVDTADIYTAGRSEELLGEFLAGAKRHAVALATKFSIATRQGDPNAGGNGRKNLMQALDGSLKRLRTDYVDLYYLHCWDGLTPVEEVMDTLDALVRAGKIRYAGFSDVPAWYAARAQTLAELRGRAPVVALQLEYSLVERHIEREHVPLAQALGMGICPWSPLAGGFLSGKYRREGASFAGDGRLQHTEKPGGMHERTTERNWDILDALAAVARELGQTPAAVALNWATKRPGVTSTIIGATSLAQLDANLAALSFDLPAPLAARLDEASRLPPSFPYRFFSAERRPMLTGGTSVAAEPAWFRAPSDPR
jgi:aryl-alcohol dehydrogenase-like predicted oxidoreductase